MSLAELLGWTAAACVVALHLPQVWRTLVRGRTAGVPAARGWVAVAVSLVWLGYGLYGGGAVQVALNTTTLALNGLLLVRLVRSRRHLLTGLLASALCGLGVVALGESTGLAGLGVVGAVSGTVLYLPQLLALRTTRDAGGVSAAALWLQGVSSACWIGYGLLRAEPAVWSPNVVGLVTTASTLLLLRLRREAAGTFVTRPGAQPALATT